MFFIKLIIKQKIYLYKLHKIQLVIDFAKYFFYITAALSVLFFRNSFTFLFPPDTMASGKMAIMIILVGTIAGHLGITISRSLTAVPFKYLMSRNNFFLTNYFYPLLSSTYFFILFQLYMMIGEKAFIYLFIFYFSYIFSKKYIYFRLFIAAVAIFLLINGSISYSERSVLTEFFLIIGFVIIIDFNLFFSKKQSSSDIVAKHFNSSLIKKEIEYYKFYQSERYYFFIALLMTLSLIVFLSINEFQNKNYSFLIWVCLTISTLPFSMTIFNLYGMDIQNLPLYLLNIKAAIDYQKKRIIYYFYSIYFFQGVFVFYFYVVFHDIFFTITLILAAIAFSELMYSTALIYSIILPEEKEMPWRYGQYFRSKNVNMIPFSIIFFYVLFDYLYTHFGLYPFVILTAIAVLFRYYLLDAILLKLMSNKLRYKYANYLF